MKPENRRTRREVLAILAALGVTGESLAQDATTTDPRSFRVVLENERVRVLEHRSGPGLAVCGQGLHYHPARVTVALTGVKVKLTSARRQKRCARHPAGARVLFSGRNALDRKRRRVRNPHLHHRTEGPGLEAQHRLTARARTRRVCARLSILDLRAAMPRSPVNRRCSVHQQTPPPSVRALVQMHRPQKGSSMNIPKRRARCFINW